MTGAREALSTSRTASSTSLGISYRDSPARTVAGVRLRTIAGMSWREWVRNAEVEPSLYAADFARLGEQIDVLLRAGCRIFHFDVGDGHFVEPVTIGPVVLESIAPLVHEAGGVLDCHLMVDNPLRHFPQIARAGGDSATFHYEVVDDVPATIAAAREHGLQAGVAFNPESEPEDVAAVAADADLVLCMSIHPGYSGQKFMPEAVDRIGRLRAALPEHVYVQVDGGIDAETIGPAHARRRGAARRRLGGLRPRGSGGAPTGASSRTSREPVRAGARARRARARQDRRPSPRRRRRRARRRGRGGGLVRVRRSPPRRGRSRSSRPETRRAARPST